MILTVTDANPGGMVPPASVASTVNVYVGSDLLKAS